MTEVEHIIGEICDANPKELRHISLNRLADYYRGGGDLRTLVPLLTHHNPEIVSGGAWIASEVVDVGHGREIFNELSQLLSHSDPAVRFWPISCVALLATASDGGVLQQWISLIADPNDGVRKQALRYLCLIPDSTLIGLKDTSLWPKVRLLLKDTEKREITAAITSENILDRRFAIAGAIRNLGKDVVAIDELSRYLCGDEVAELSHLLS